MGPCMTIVRRLLDIIEILLRYSVAVLVLIIVLMVATQVIFRYLLAEPIAWSEEFITLTFQWLSFFGAALAVRERGHFGVDIFARLLGKKWNKFLKSLNHVVIIMIGMFMIFYGMRIVENSSAQMYPTLPFSVGTGYLVLPISGLLILLMEYLVVLNDRRILATGEGSHP